METRHAQNREADVCLEPWLRCEARALEGCDRPSPVVRTTQAQEKQKMWGKQRNEHIHEEFGGFSGVHSHDRPFDAKSCSPDPSRYQPQSSGVT